MSAGRSERLPDATSKAEARVVADQRFGASVFVCSKPLQFLFSASIVRAYRIEDPTIYVVTGTMVVPREFEAFVNDCDYRGLFRQIVFRPDHADIASELKRRNYDTLFVEDDRVSLYRLFAPLKTDRFAIFEEGVGTYRNDYRTHMSPLRLAKWLLLSQLTGCGLQRGDGRATDHVMVQHPDAYAQMNKRNAHKALPIPRLLEEFRHNRPRWDAVLEQAGVKEPGEYPASVALVLGTWGGAPGSVIETIAAKYDRVYYKAHPNDGMIVDSRLATVINLPWAPAEVFVDYFARSAVHLDVYHFSSSVELNCLDAYSNVGFVDLARDPRLSEVLAQVAATRA